MNLALDQSSLNMLDLLYPGFRDDLLDVLGQIVMTTGLNVRLTAGFRTVSEQQADYNQGRTTPGRIITNAEPFETFHNYGLAADFCFRGMDPYLAATANSSVIWSQVGGIASQGGLTWGGTFKFQDRPHLENTYGLYWENCNSLVEDDGISGLWTFLDKKRGVQPGLNWRQVPGLYLE